MIEAYGFGTDGNPDKMWRLVYYETPLGNGNMMVEDDIFRSATEEDFIVSVVSRMVLYA